MFIGHLSANQHLLCSLLQTIQILTFYFYQMKAWQLADFLKTQISDFILNLQLFSSWWNKTMSCFWTFMFCVHLKKNKSEYNFWRQGKWLFNDTVWEYLSSIAIKNKTNLFVEKFSIAIPTASEKSKVSAGETINSSIVVMQFCMSLH